MHCTMKVGSVGDPLGTLVSDVARVAAWMLSGQINPNREPRGAGTDGTKKLLGIIMLKNIKWHEHSGEHCPVPPNSRVIYKTIWEDRSGTQVSHTHAPARAYDINWKSYPAIGRVYKYAVVPG